MMRLSLLLVLAGPCCAHCAFVVSHDFEQVAVINVDHKVLRTIDDKVKVLIATRKNRLNRLQNVT